MFHSEQLQEKWAPLLNHEGLDEIKDSHRRAVTAVLLENQEKFLREQSAFESGTSMLTEAIPATEVTEAPTILFSLWYDHPAK